MKLSTEARSRRQGTQTVRRLMLNSIHKKKYFLYNSVYNILFVYFCSNEFRKLSFNRQAIVIYNILFTK